MIERRRKPHRALQLGVAIGTLLLIGVPLVILVTRGIPDLEVDGLGGLLQAVESGIQDVVFLAIGAYFLFTIEARLDRRASLRELHRLRSIVHIVDMAQLTKDPEHLVSGSPLTHSSPERQLSHFEMSRYLDYCTELLSLASKVAAIHLQSVNDPVVLEAVNDIENLAASLSNKIWQKIMIIDAHRFGTPSPGGGWRHSVTAAVPGAPDAMKG